MKKMVSPTPYKIYSYKKERLLFCNLSFCFHLVFITRAYFQYFYIKFKEVIVESFELDHTIVKAPYVRLIGEETGPKGDIISNFDIRLVQPNEDSIPTAGLHTIEHLLAKLIRTRIDGMIDCSPFGCRTGFHMIMWGRHTSAEIATVIKDSLKEIAETTTWEDVPGTTIESCGNYKDHSLFSAKEWAKLILEQGISDDAFERHVI